MHEKIEEAKVIVNLMNDYISFIESFEYENTYTDSILAMCSNRIEKMKEEIDYGD